jgi:hypothetical protein
MGKSRNCPSPWITQHRAIGNVPIQLISPTYTFTPNSNRLMNSPITVSCSWTDCEKQIVFLTKRLIRVRSVRCLRSSCCVLRLPRERRRELLNSYPWTRMRKPKSCCQSSIPRKMSWRSVIATSSVMENTRATIGLTSFNTARKTKRLKGDECVVFIPATYL